MAISKNNTIIYSEVIDYLLPSGVSNNYMDQRVDNSGSASTIWDLYKPGAKNGNGGSSAGSNTFTDSWTIPTTDAQGRVIYSSVAQVNLAQLIKNYLNANGYNSKRYNVITVQDLVKIQSMIIAFIQTNVHQFYALVNPNNASYGMNQEINTRNSIHGKRQFTTPRTYTPINTNPGINVPTIDPNNLLAKKYNKITADDVKRVRDLIINYLDTTSTLTLNVTEYCHTNCYCHSCCCSCSCGHGRWL